MPVIRLRAGSFPFILVFLF